MNKVSGKESAGNDASMYAAIAWQYALFIVSVEPATTEFESETESFLTSVFCWEQETASAVNTAVMHKYRIVLPISTAKVIQFADVIFCLKYRSTKNASRQPESM